jgi:cytochrome c6
MMNLRQKFLLPLLILLPVQIMAASPRDGQPLYQRNCVMCHGMDGNSMMANAPSFKRGQGLFKSDQALQEHLRKGKNACPSFFGILREKEMLDVIAYIRTMYP